jgi:1,4-alpha-glucan branching enzyme
MGHFSFELLGRSERAILNTALEPMTLSNIAETAPTPTLGDNFTEVLRDRRVTFRLLAPKANAVEVVIGIKSGIYEPQGPRSPR